MARNPGNKIFKDNKDGSITVAPEHVNDVKKLIEANENRDETIRKFYDAQKRQLADAIKNVAYVEKQVEFLSKEIDKSVADDPTREAQYKELEKRKEELSRLKRVKAQVAANIEKSGEDSIKVEAERMALEQAKAEEYRERVERLRALNAAYKRLLDKGDASKEELEQLKADIEEAEKAVNDPSLLNNANYLSKSSKTTTVLNAIAGSGIFGAMGDAVAAVGKESKYGSGEQLASKIGEKVGGSVGGPLGKIINVAGKILDVTTAMRKSINSWVDQAAEVLANNVGKINAALEGTGQTYESTTDKMVEALGLNRFVKQTDYISNIAELTARGVTYNVEQRAILETIKDKTIASFNSMDASLLRLVRLKQTDLTATQFGLEAALRNTLNRVFKDSTYMRDMFDSISGAITDAVMISGNKDVTEYSSVVQTWMGAMYEAGVDSNMVSKMANAINALGSGNISALASDQDMQRLILLSMDTIGMDYADILQQGLAPSDINDLLTAVVKYLVKIESNTKDNNVLQASYTGLFGMSMSDLQAMKTLSTKMGSLTSVNQGTALATTKAEVEALETTSRTIVAEQVNNAFANARFTFGSSIAKDASSYLTWKISNLLLDVTDSVVNSPAGKFPLATAIAKGVGRAAQIGIFANELKGILSLAEALPSLFKSETGGVSYLINGAPSYGGAGSGSVSGSVTAAGSNFKTVDTMSKITSHTDYQTAYQSYSSKEWDAEEEDEDKVVSMLESALVKHNAEESKKAFATYLVGMTDETLMSFASIFADEDAMTDTFGGENNVLKDNLFKYGEDTTSNSKDNNSKGNS